MQVTTGIYGLGAIKKEAQAAVRQGVSLNEFVANVANNLVFVYSQAYRAAEKEAE